MTKLVLFDIDDTLIDHTAAARAGVVALHAMIEAPRPFDDFLGSWHAAMRQNFPLYLSGQLSYQDQRRSRVRATVNATLTDDQADELFVHYFQAYESHWTLFSDVLSCLDDLADFRLGIISNGHGIEQRSKLERTGIAERFETIHISSDRGPAKPLAEIFQHACRSADVEFEDAVYIGDMYEIDAVGARQAGLTGIWLDRNRSRGDAHARPIIDGLGELSALLRATPAPAP